MSTPPSDRRPDTQHSGRALSSSDFGSSFGGSPPEQIQIKGLGLPPPTQFIPVPTKVHSTDAVVNSLVAQPSIATRATKLARASKHHARVFAETLADYGVDAGRFAMAQLSRVARALEKKQLGSEAKAVTLTAVRTTAKYSVLGSRASVRAAKSAYQQLRRAVDDGYAAALDAERSSAKKAPQMLAVKSALRARAGLNAPLVVELPLGSVVTVYPQHEAPGGWVLAQGPGGDIGFMLVDDLETPTAV